MNLNLSLFPGTKFQTENCNIKKFQISLLFSSHTLCSKGEKTGNENESDSPYWDFNKN